jgi:hypothetical protein
MFAPRGGDATGWRGRGSRLPTRTCDMHLGERAKAQLGIHAPKVRLLLVYIVISFCNTTHGDIIPRSTQLTSIAITEPDIN